MESHDRGVWCSKRTLIVTKRFDRGLFYSLRNIASNKLCTLVSRTEVRDFYDFYKIMHFGKKLNFQAIISDAVKKEALFDDPPTVAYVIEEKLDDMPVLFKETLEIEDENEIGEMISYYKDMANEIYHAI